MVADQVVHLPGRGAEHVRDVGRFVYATGRHAHWHLRSFERYELRHVDDASIVAHDRKIGFCLGDGYVSRLRTPLAPRVYTRRIGLCRRDEPRAAVLRQGISPGYGDAYGPRLEGQSVALEGLPSGRYLLVHRVNPDGRLRESSQANNAASALIALSWPRGQRRAPRIVTLAVCEHAARCSQ